MHTFHTFSPLFCPALPLPVVARLHGQRRRRLRAARQSDADQPHQHAAPRHRLGLPQGVRRRRPSGIAGQRHPSSAAAPAPPAAAAPTVRCDRRDNVTVGRWRLRTARIPELRATHARLSAQRQHQQRQAVHGRRPATQRRPAGTAGRLHRQRRRLRRRRSVAVDADADGVGRCGHSAAAAAAHQSVDGNAAAAAAARAQRRQCRHDDQPPESQSHHHRHAARPGELRVKPRH